MQTFTSTPLNEVRNRLLTHSIYQSLQSVEHLRIFMQHHVFAVWDFMSLLKRLQLLLTCTNLPWIPARNAKLARFINEIVLAEETDSDGRDGYVSHFECYLLAMEEINADTKPILKFVEQIRQGRTYAEALHDPDIPSSIRPFVTYNLSVALTSKDHEVAAAFFYGREDLIPEMFCQLLEKIPSTKWLNYYLKRHIELDEDEHGPLAEELLNHLCGSDVLKIEEAKQIAITSLKERLALWDNVLAEIKVYGG